MINNTYFENNLLCYYGYAILFKYDKWFSSISALYICAWLLHFVQFLIWKKKMHVILFL